MQFFFSYINLSFIIHHSSFCHRHHFIVVIQFYNSQCVRVAEKYFCVIFLCFSSHLATQKFTHKSYFFTCSLHPYSTGLFSRSFREINLNIWHSAEAAHAWYKGNHTHRELVNQYHSRDLNSFSAMTASLTTAPDRPVRWNNRCRVCHRLAPGHDPQECPVCGAGIEPMAYF